MKGGPRLLPSAVAEGRGPRAEGRGPRAESPEPRAAVLSLPGTGSPRRLGRDVGRTVGPPRAGWGAEEVRPPAWGSRPAPPLGWAGQRRLIPRSAPAGHRPGPPARSAARGR